MALDVVPGVETSATWTGLQLHYAYRFSRRKIAHVTYSHQYKTLNQLNAIMSRYRPKTVSTLGSVLGRVNVCR